MAFTRRDFVKGGVAAFTWGFAAPAFLSDVAHAQGAASRNLVVLYLGGGNDSLNTVVPYGDALLLLAPADDRHPAGIGAADRQRRRRQRARPAPEPGRPAQHLQPGPHGGHPAHRLPEPEPLALPRHRHLVDREHVRAAGAGLARALPRHAAAAGRSAGRLEHQPRAAADDDRPHRLGAVDPEPVAVRVLEPEQRHARSELRPHVGDAHLVARAGQPPAPRVRQRLRPGRVRDHGPRRPGGAVRADRDLPEHRPRQRPARGRRGDRPRHRHQGVLGADRRLRHACPAGHRRGGHRRLPEPDGDDRRRDHGVLHRHAEPGADQPDDAADVLGVRPPRRRERHPGHRPRRGRRDVRHRRRRPRRRLRHGARTSIPSPGTRRSPRAAATSAGTSISAASTPRSSTAGWAATRSPSSAATTASTSTSSP